MNIMWLTNIPLPEASILMNDELYFTGGWIESTAICLSQQNGINFSVTFPRKGVNKIKYLKGKNINYYVFSSINDSSTLYNNYNNLFEYLLKIINPDIVHIFGTEFPHTLSMVNMCNKMNIKVIISIQGLVSLIGKHYMSCLPNSIQKRFTLRDFIKQDNLVQQQKKYINRGKLEIEAIKKIKHVIGRTTWDKACITQINPNIKYHFCNETLREEFYKHKWSLEECEKYSIFISQAYYPIKGFHFMIEAMPFILKMFPNAKLYISGPNIIKSYTLKDKLKKTTYTKYIEGLIKKFNLKDKIIFTGLLNEKQMCERYLKTNVFVCPSSIENSPNSVGEAMLLGVPCVASNVGGISDMLKHKEEGFLYQMDAPYMLAYYVCEIFKNKEVALKISRNSRKHASEIYDKKENLNALLNIYKEIINE